MTATTYATPYQGCPPNTSLVDVNARAFITSFSPPPTTPVNPGESVFIAGKLWTNQTDDVIAIPSEPCSETMLAAGFTVIGSTDKEILSVVFNEETDTLIITLKGEDEEPFEASFHALREIVAVIDTLNDIDLDISAEEGKLTIVTNDTDDGLKKKGIYRGNGTDVDLILGDDNDTYELKWNDTNSNNPAEIELWANGELQDHFPLPFTDYQYAGLITDPALVPEDDRIHNTIWFCAEPADETIDRGIYYVQNDGDELELQLAIPKDRLQYLGHFDTFLDLPELASVDKVLSIVTQESDQGPRGLYEGNGDDPILIQEYHDKSWTGWVEQVADFTEANFVKDTITIVTVGNDVEPRGVYEGNGNEAILILPIPEKFRIKAWKPSDHEEFYPGDVFIKEDLTAMNALRLFKVPNNWIPHTTVTNSAWTLTEQKRYYAISTERVDPIGHYVVGSSETVPYPASTGTGKWIVDFDIDKIFYLHNNSWVEYNSDNIVDGARLNIAGTSEIWFWNKANQTWDPDPTPPAQVQLRLYPQQTITDIKAIEDPEDFAITFDNETNMCYEFHFGTDFENHPHSFPDDGNTGYWVWRPIINHLPLRLDPVADQTALEGIENPHDFSIVKVSSQPDLNSDGYTNVYIFHYGMAQADSNAQWDVADVTGTGYWVKQRELATVNPNMFLAADDTVRDVPYQVVTAEIAGLNIQLLPVVKNHVIDIVTKEVPVTIVADGTEQFTNILGTSTDSKLIINEAFRKVTLIGTDTEWLVVV